MNFHQKPTTFVANVTLNVTDLSRSTAFYEQVIGFRVLTGSTTKVELTADGKTPLLTLIQPKDVQRKEARTTGLYHFAILLPTRQALASLVPHLVQQGIQLGSSDHKVSEALYFADPDGNGIEIYRDRLPEEWTWQGDSVEMTVDPLDFNDLLAKETVSEWTGLPHDTVMGHIHLHVDDLQAAEQFYTQALDFEVVTRYGHQALFIADNRYHHHIGLNVWNGVGAPQPAKHSVGLVHFTLDVKNASKQKELAKRLEASGARVEWMTEVLLTEDPAGNEIHIVY